MPSLILNSDVLSVRKERRHLQICRRTKGDTKSSRMRVPLIDLDRVVVVGRPDITVPVLQALMFEGIPTYFVTVHGRWIGSLSPDNNKNALRRIRQYELAGNPAFQLDVARKMVQAKILNSRRVLQRLAANRQASHHSAQKRVEEQLKKQARAAAYTESVAELRGYEGVAAAAYFERLSCFFPEKIPFNGRNRRPPRDAANALLSWTYAIFQGELDGAVRAHGLDSGFGCLHGVEYGRPSLVLDLMEPFRAPMCDLLVLNLLNHRVLNETHFEYRGDEEGVRLKEDARKPFFMAYETAMTRKFILRRDQPHTDFRNEIERMVLQYMKAMDGGEYEFFRMP